MSLRKKLLRASAAALSAVMLCTVFPHTGTAVNAADLTVTVSPHNASSFNDGVFEGWGTSMCWWANRIGYSDTLSQKAAELFFSTDGLGLNIARFNIGGGDDPTHTHIKRTDSNMPGYMRYNSSTGRYEYDWSADYNQRNVLNKIVKACGDELIVEAFSNSPPYFMTKSGCSTGNTDSSKNNLKDDMYDDFAAYLAEVALHYKNEWGITFQSITAMNEPYTDYWGAFSNKQEGCHFDIGASQSNIIVELSKALKSRGLGDMIISASDESVIDTQISAFNALSSEAKGIIPRIDTHTYGGSQRTQLRTLAENNGKNLWMSEVDGGSTAGSNAGEMGAGLWLAQRISTDINGLMPSAWILWQVIDNHISSTGYNGNKDSGMVNTSGGYWGLAVANHDTNEIILTKKYYAYGQFSRYIRPGYTILGSSSDTVAAYDKNGKKIVIVATNTSGSAKECNYDLSQFSKIGSSVKVIRTSNNENWAELSPLSTNGKGFTANLKANSVTTFIIENSENATDSLNEIKLSSGMLTSSTPWDGSTVNTVQKVIDGSVSTFFDGVSDGWLQIDLGKEYVLDALSFAPRPDMAYRSIHGSFYGSTDGTNWTQLHRIEEMPYYGLNYVYAEKFTGSNRVRYIKYSVPSGAPTTSLNKDSNYCANIAEVKLYGSEYNAVTTTTTVTTSTPETHYGDINLDGNVTAVDVIAFVKHFLGEQLTGQALKNADVLADGSIALTDLAKLKQYCVGDKVTLGV